MIRSKRDTPEEEKLLKQMAIYSPRAAKIHKRAQLRSFQRSTIEISKIFRSKLSTEDFYALCEYAS